MIKKKILVIGSNSFAGSIFIDHALKKNFIVVGISRSSENNDIIYLYCKQLPQLTELEREKKTLLKKITEKVYNECKHEWEKETCETSQLSSRHSSDEFKTYDIYFCNKCSLCKK